MKYFVLLVLILLMVGLSGCEPRHRGEYERDMKLLGSNPDAHLVMQLIRECNRASTTRRAEACFDALEGFNVTIPKDKRNK